MTEEEKQKNAEQTLNAEQQDRQEKAAEDTERAHGEVSASAVSAEGEQAEETVSGEPEIPREETGAAQPVSHARSGLSLTPLIGVVLGLGAIGLSAYLWWQLQHEERRIGRDLVQVTDQIRHLEEQLQALASRLEGVATDNRQRDRQLSDRLQTLSALGTRLNAAEQAIASLSGTSVSARKAWLEAEAEYLLQIANSRLHLAQDLKTSLAALKAADERLRALDRPDLFDVRSQLAREIQTLESVAQPDIEGIALKLGALAAGVNRFPLKNTLPTRQSEGQVAPDDQPAGWSRAKGVLGNALKGMVSVRRTDEAIVPLLAAEDEFLLRRNVELQLLAARLAALKGDQSNYLESLRMAKRWLTEYFDMETTAVTRAIERVGELESEDIQLALPDISGSLKLLRERTGPEE